MHATLRWTARHHSAGEVPRVARFAVAADGEWHTCRVDLVQTGWIGEALAISSITLSPARVSVDVAVDRITLVPW